MMKIDRALSGSQAGLMTNVQLKLFDKETNQLVAMRNVHNKASAQMVRGLLWFLQGAFTGSNTVSSYDATKALYAHEYIPSYMYAGDAGLVVNQNTHVYSDYTVPATPTFTDSSLVRAINDPEGIDSIREAIYAPPSDPTVVNNSLAMTITSQFNEYALVRQVNNRTLYRDRTYNVTRVFDLSLNEPETRRGTLITEVALYSDKIENGGKLLARAVFDDTSTIDSSGYPDDSQISPVRDVNRTPVFKSDKEYLVINWRIAIVSVGMNDTPPVPINNTNT